MRSLLAVCAVALTGAILPAGAVAAGTLTGEQLPDHYTGVWPAELMPDETPLGTLTWRAIRYEEGLALVGKVFGGKVFEGCPANGETRFFRGSYVEGGDLVGCTIGADAKRLIGRFNGREDFMSGSFDVAIAEDDPNEFVGKYFEDQGITTDWCGDKDVAASALPPTFVDTLAPRVTALAATARAGALVPLRARVSDDSGAATRLRLTVTRGSRLLKTLSLAAHSDGSVTTARWRAPRALRGTLTVCATALDAAGHTSSRSCAPLRLR
jgi:hypothetical protein